MYAIKVWSTKAESSWYLMRDLQDNVVHCYGRQGRAEAVVKHLLEQNPKNENRSNSRYQCGSR